MYLYHGGLGKIRRFDSDYAGMTTADNEHGAFYFSNDKNVAIDYSVQAFKRAYQDNTECLVRDNILDYLPEFNGNEYDFVDGLAYENINVVTAKIAMNNPFVIDANYKNLRELEKQFNIQNAIGFIKGNAVDEIPEQFVELCEYDEEYEEYGEIPEFDGIIIKNVIDDIGDASCVYQDVHIAINPDQITILEQLQLIQEKSI